MKGSYLINSLIENSAEKQRKLLQINVSANWGSHGRIAEEIGRLAMAQGWESYIAYGRVANPSNSKLIKIGNGWNVILHGIQSRLLGNHGLSSKMATRRLVKTIEIIKPDIIHLHNIHGYYLNYPILFDFLSKYNKPVIWTLHDCWPFTGHCAYFTYVKCNKWKEHCYECPNKKCYPTSLLLDKSEKNFKLKKTLFNTINEMTLVPVSEWLSDLLAESFLKDYPRLCIHNGIDLNIFTYNKELFSLYPGKKVVLGVSSVWEPRKGLKDFVEMRSVLGEEYIIILIGLTKKQIDVLPKGIIGIKRTNNVQELVAYYSRADVFINPTYEDNFPTTNIEALACGTPVISYNTGGSPESIDEHTGMVVPVGNIRCLVNSITQICGEKNRDEIRRNCRKRAERMFNMNDRYQEYVNLYESLLAVSPVEKDA